ncbi:MAG: PaaI family thioesterase [Bacteroidota bacterium]
MTINEFQTRDKFAVWLGIQLLEAANGHARSKLKIKPEHLNGVDILHGGVVFSLADFTMAAAANSHGNMAVGINSSMLFVKAIQQGTIYAEATQTSIRAKLATYTIHVTDEQGELIAALQGMVYRKKEMY